MCSITNKSVTEIGSYYLYYHETGLIRKVLYKQIQIKAKCYSSLCVIFLYSGSCACKVLKSLKIYVGRGCLADSVG